MAPPGHVVCQPVTHKAYPPDVCAPQIPAFALPCYECPHHTWTVPALILSWHVDLRPEANVAVLTSCNAWMRIQVRSHVLLAFQRLEATSS